MDNSENNSFAGAYLRELRKEKKLSLFKVSKQIGISGNYLSEIERGKKNPSDFILGLLADFYDIDKNKLFGMYGKFYNEDFEYLKEHPELIKLFTQIVTDKRNSDDDIYDIAKELHNVYFNILKKRT